jgi:hypothetical protein
VSLDHRGSAVGWRHFAIQRDRYGRQMVSAQLCAYARLIIQAANVPALSVYVTSSLAQYIMMHATVTYVQCRQNSRFQALIGIYKDYLDVTWYNLV